MYLAMKSAQRRDQFNFHSCIARQLSNTYGAAGMFARIPEYLHQEFGSSVDNGGLLIETRRRGHKAGELEYSPDSIKRSERLSKARQGLQDAKAGGHPGQFQIDFSAHFSSNQGIALTRQLPADKGQSLMDGDRHILKSRRCGSR